MNTHKQTLLDSIKTEIINRQISRELAESATQLVFGNGNPDADVMFIGEAPGKKEDVLGVPFVGAAGKFLDEMLQSIGLKREDVYITNIVKYRPPNNRDPLQTEKDSFLPYLIEQINVIQPKLIVTLGRHSMECFLPGMIIGEVHGRVNRVVLDSNKQKAESNDQTLKVQLESNSTAQDEALSTLKSQPYTLNLIILPLYHPAAALYNGGLRQTLLQDFAKIPEIIKSINKESK